MIKELFNTLSGLNSWQAAQKIMDDIIYDERKFLHDKYRSTSERVGTLGLINHKDEFINIRDKHIAIIKSDEQYIDEELFSGTNQYFLIDILGQEILHARRGDDDAAEYKLITFDKQAQKTFALAYSIKLPQL